MSHPRHPHRTSHCKREHNPGDLSCSRTGQRCARCTLHTMAGRRSTQPQWHATSRHSHASSVPTAPTARAAMVCVVGLAVLMTVAGSAHSRAPAAAASPRSAGGGRLLDVARLATPMARAGDSPAGVEECDACSGDSTGPCRHDGSGVCHDFYTNTRACPSGTSKCGAGRSVDAMAVDAPATCSGCWPGTAGACQASDTVCTGTLLGGAAFPQPRCAPGSVLCAAAGSLAALPTLRVDAWVAGFGAHDSADAALDTDAVSAALVAAVCAPVGLRRDNVVVEHVNVAPGSPIDGADGVGAARVDVGMIVVVPRARVHAAAAMELALTLDDTLSSGAVGKALNLAGFPHAVVGLHRRVEFVVPPVPSPVNGARALDESAEAQSAAPPGSSGADATYGAENGQLFDGGDGDGPSAHDLPWWDRAAQYMLDRKEVVGGAAATCGAFVVLGAVVALRRDAGARAPHTRRQRPAGPVRQSTIVNSPVHSLLARPKDTATTRSVKAISKAAAATVRSPSEAARAEAAAALALVTSAAESARLERIANPRPGQATTPRSRRGAKRRSSHGSDASVRAAMMRVGGRSSLELATPGVNDSGACVVAVRSDGNMLSSAGSVSSLSSGYTAASRGSVMSPTHSVHSVHGRAPRSTYGESRSRARRDKARRTSTRWHLDDKAQGSGHVHQPAFGSVATLPPGCVTPALDG